MASKQLQSIMESIPSATAQSPIDQMAKEIETIEKKSDTPIKYVKIVATATPDIKEELKQLAKNLGVTETAIILQALKNFGFQSIDKHMLVDKRKLR